MKSKDKYFIRTKGKNEFKTYHLINADTIDMLEMFFTSQLQAIEYASKHNLIIIEYNEKFETDEKRN